MTISNFTPTELVESWISSDPILRRIASDLAPYGLRTLEEGLRAVAVSIVRERRAETADIELIAGLLSFALSRADWTGIARGLADRDRFPPF